MVFGGFQKLTLLDYPGKVACTLFTRGCNFYCPFCHNALLVDTNGNEQTYSEEDVLSYLNKRQGILEGVCISGGEPLLHASLREFIQKVKALGYCVKLDTNGSFPDKMIELIEDSLIDYVAMDIKNSFEKYALTSGKENLNISDIEKSIDYLLKGNIDYEFRTTVTEETHTPQDIEKIALRIKGANKYFLQNFVDSGNIIGENLHPVDENILEKMEKAAKKSVPNAVIRGKS